MKFTRIFSVALIIGAVSSQLLYTDPVTELFTMMAQNDIEMAAVGYAWQLIDCIIQDLSSRRLSLPEAARLSVPDQVRSHNLTFEDHTVQTQDGYILNLWHVFDENAVPKINPKDGKKQVVFMQHGLIDAAGTFLFNEPELSPAYTLAKEGYDMWFGNSRGSVNSLGHVNMTYKQAEYWNFTFEQMGKYDVPANLDYILNFTGVEKIYYLGHS